MLYNNSTSIDIESWFIPSDILMIVCAILIIIFPIVYLFIIISDKTCHTIPMMLVANSCIATFVSGCSLFSLGIYTLEYDLKRIQYQDSLCIFRGYIAYIACGLFNTSFLLQAVYRYVTVVYPHRVFYQSTRFQAFLICLTWIFAVVNPIAFMFTNEILYNIDNQICQLPLKLSFSIIYIANSVYTIHVLLIIIIYFKLVFYVHQMSKRVTPVNTLFRAQRELKMVRRTVILVAIQIVACLPYGIFILMSFFTSIPKYHFRIAILFIGISIVFIMIILFKFTDPMKISLMKRINKHRNRIIPAIT